VFPFLEIRNTKKISDEKEAVSFRGGERRKLRRRIKGESPAI